MLSARLPFTTREMLDDCRRFGLEDDDLELIEKWMAEEGLR